MESRKSEERSGSDKSESHTHCPGWLRQTSMIIAAAAVGMTLFCVGIGYFPARGAPGRLAAKWLIPDHLRSDWDWALNEYRELHINNRELATHIELAGIQRRWFFKTEVDELHRQYVLNPVVEDDDDIHWRRPLWEGLSQLVRRSRSNTEAALTVRRKLYERVSLVDQSSDRLLSTWNNRQGNDRDFEKLTVAALRAVGIPARLTNSLAIYYDSEEWLRFPDIDDYVAVLRSRDLATGD